MAKPSLHPNAIQCKWFLPVLYTSYFMNCKGTAHSVSRIKNLSFDFDWIQLNKNRPIYSQHAEPMGQLRDQHLFILIHTCQVKNVSVIYCYSLLQFFFAGFHIDIQMLVLQMIGKESTLIFFFWGGHCFGWTFACYSTWSPASLQCIYF